MSERLSQQICRWLEEEEEECFDVSEDEGDGEEDLVLESEHGSETEQETSADSEDEEAPDVTNSHFVGKDGTKWRTLAPPVNTRTRAHNIVFHPPLPKLYARDAKTCLECLALFIDEKILRIILVSTNAYIEKVRFLYQRERDAKCTDETELKALLGILFLTGVCKSSRQNITDIWKTDGTGIETIFVTMSYHRFRFLLRCLRFDNFRDRAQRRELDKLAALREVFEIFTLNCRQSFTLSDYVTIDEKLVKFRGRCGFRMYMPNKPGKYGIKVFALVDTKNAYTSNLEVYLGQQPEGPYSVSNKSHDVVKRLVEPIRGTNRNVTMDNWFSSFPLALDLLKNEKLTMVGTVRKNKREIPAEFINAKGRAVPSNLFGFQNDMTLVSHVPKRNKVVLALSTMHHDSCVDIETGVSQKPEIITFYNRTKVGVDVLDQMTASYDVSRNSRRWPLTLFFDLMNIAAINALNVYSKNNELEKLSRRNFLQELSLALMKPEIKRRTECKSVSRGIRERGKLLLGTEEETVTPVQHPNGIRGRCFLCGRQRNKSTRHYCVKCVQWVCAEHFEKVCVRCTRHGQRSETDSE